MIGPLLLEHFLQKSQNILNLKYIIVVCTDSRTVYPAVQSYALCESQPSVFSGTCAQERKCMQNCSHSSSVIQLIFKMFVNGSH